MPYNLSFARIAPCAFSVACLAFSFKDAYAQNAPLKHPYKKQIITHKGKEIPQSLQAITSENILVRARRREQMEVKSGGQLGTLGNVKGLDAPFNIRSYTSSIILNQQSQTLGDVLENDPSIRTTFGYGNFSQQFLMRGFPVYGDDVSINGLYGIAPRQLLSPQILDQVQVLNGASAFVNGAAPGGTAIGGNINLLLKHATKDPITRLTGDYTSTGQGGGAIDLGRRFGTDHAFGARLNVAGLSGKTPIDHEHRDSTALGADFDWHNDRTRISLDIDYQKEGVRWGRAGVFLNSALTSLPKVPSAKSNYGQPWTFTDLQYLFGMLNVEHDLNRHITLYGAFGGIGSNEKGNYSNLTVNNGETGAGTYGNLYVPYVNTNESTRAGVRIRFNTFGVHHTINTSGSGLWATTATAYAFGSGPIAGNLYSPVYTSTTPSQNIVGGNLSNPQRTAFTRLWSIAFADTISAFNNRVLLTGGFRYQNIVSNNYSYATTLRLSHINQDAVTPVLGVVIHPTRKTSIYFNRVEGLSQGPTASGSVVNIGQVFPPYRSLQYELGTKYETGRFSASIAIYQVNQNYSYVAPYGNGQQIFTVNGLQRNRGLEANINGTVVKGLRFNGGATINDAKIRHSAQNILDHKTAIGVPDYMINGNIEYDFPYLRGMTLTARVINTGKQWVNTMNTLKIPNWTTFGIGARYTFITYHKPLTLRFGIDNIGNHRYWSSALGGYLAQGMPRTYKASFTMDF
ncbi:TonB-dependent receptor [Swingsia samuiensis]|uniref:TonB-dependent siderophore receptor n=1 Tax=Swingsia samuiensis TaxID=1293412 RepID=A0A4Y6UJY5_9PROT|nr:TonB-dependent siderophore receptor [Swingsia samuiensis]QDH17374.1 TonB-dependent siderophore receptor [Swingsia samuiensis]